MEAGRSSSARKQETASTPKLPLKIPQITSDRGFKALDRGTLGGLGGELSLLHAVGMSQPPSESSVDPVRYGGTSKGRSSIFWKMVLDRGPTPSSQPSSNEALTPREAEIPLSEEQRGRASAKYEFPSFARGHLRFQRSGTMLS